MSNDMSWVVIYSHRHGTDVWLEATRELAVLSLVDTVLGYTYELDEETCEQFLQHIVSGEFSLALSAYFSDMGFDEDFEIYQLNRSDPPSQLAIQERAAAELAELRSKDDDEAAECLDPDYVLKVWVAPGEPVVHIRAKGKDVRRGGQTRTEYRLEVIQGGKVIFPYGQLFCSPGPGYTERQTKALIVECVSMSPDGGHGVDDDFFVDYTDEQKEWANRYGEALGLEARAYEEDPE